MTQQASAPAPVIESLDPEPRPNVDLHFLQVPSIYQQLPVDDIPKAFLASSNRPNPGASLADLLRDGHFRTAAYVASNELIRSHDPVHILQLLYTRLACLVLISRPDIAAQEANPLIQLLARDQPGAKDIVPLIPWELRLLLVRLHGMSAEDGGRRGIMALYALAGEARANLSQAREAGNDQLVANWKSRLQDLGLRVAEALVERGEFETAERHLDSLTGSDRGEIMYRKALLRLRGGDVNGAQQIIDKLEDGSKRACLSALLLIADGDFPAAINACQQSDDALSVQNLAVCRLYTGHITYARDLFEEVITNHPASPGLLFNLSTVYELCSERAIEHKTALVQRVAAKNPAPHSGGWERANIDFKL